MEHRLPARIVAHAREEHAQEIGQRANAADGGAATGAAALLLQCHGGRQTFDGINVGYRHLIDKPPRVRAHRFEIASLRLCVKRAECQ
jgi:hypothetical protein